MTKTTKRTPARTNKDKQTKWIIGSGLALGLGVGALLLLRRKPAAPSTVIVQTPTSTPVVQRVSTPTTTQKTTQPTTQATHYYAKGITSVWKDVNVNTIETATHFRTRYEGAGWTPLTKIPAGTYLGAPTGQYKEPMVQLKTILNGKLYTFWADEREMEKSSSFNSAKSKSATTISEIVSNY